jgi:guanylate kinase
VRGLILYGPPASGKDTVTAALDGLAGRYRLIPKLKVGSGNTRGYRMVTYAQLTRLRRQGRVVQENMRYGNIYAVDRSMVNDARIDGDAPVLHTGRLDDLRTIERSLPGPWTVVVLWCGRRTAERRSIARGDTDTVDRLKVWDETLSELPGLASDEVSLWIDTDAASPDTAAAMIDQVIGSGRRRGDALRDLSSDPPVEDGPGLIVPVVTPSSPGRGLDARAVVSYARRFAVWHPSAVPLVAGSYGRGAELDPADRRTLVRLWTEALGPRSLAVAAYDAAEVDRMVEDGRWPVFVPPAGSSVRSLRQHLGGLLPEVWIYSHPNRYVVDPGDAVRLGPRGLKLAKCRLDRLAEVRAAVGPDADLWHATARDPAGSRAHGATSLVAACLADLPLPSPAPRSPNEIGWVATRALRRLDLLGGHDHRVAALEESVRKQLASG